MTSNPIVSAFLFNIGFMPISASIQFIISCFICGSVDSKANKIYSVLDVIPVNHLSDYEYKQWIIFKSISLKTRFGFTIGGFASLKKTTLISVCILLYYLINI